MNHATVPTEDLFHSILYTVEKFPPFSYKMLYVLLKSKFLPCKSEHKPGTAFVHFLFTADYFYQCRTPELTIL
jgi:hypothetical protein